MLMYGDYPGGLNGKESASNAGDPSWTPGLGRSTGEWASLVAQLVKNPLAMRETWV